MTTSAGKTKRFNFTPLMRLTGRDPQRSPQYPLSATASPHCCPAEVQGASLTVAQCTHDPGAARWRLSDRRPRPLLACTVFWICDTHAPLNARNLLVGSEVAQLSDEGVNRFIWTFFGIQGNFDVTSFSWEKCYFPQVKNVLLPPMEAL